MITKASDVTHDNQGFDVDEAKGQQTATEAHETLSGPAAWEAQKNARVDEMLAEQAANNPPVPDVPEVEAQDPMSRAKADTEKRLEKCANYMEVVALEKEFEAFKPTTKLEARIKNACIQQARVRRFEMQQSPQPPELRDANTRARMEKTFREQPSKMAERLTRLVAERTSGAPVAFPEIPKTKNKLALPAFVLLLDNAEIRDRITDYRDAFAAYAEEYISVQDLANPGEKVTRLQRELGGCRDMDRVRELRAEIAGLASIGEGTATHRQTVAACRAGLMTLDGKVKTALGDLLIVTEQQLTEHLAKARDTERDWYAGFNLSVSGGPLTQKFADALSKVKQMRAGLQTRRGNVLPGIHETNCRELFGLSLCQ